MKRQPKKQPETSDRLVVASNRKARYDYEIVESHEAGIVLVGSEVKSIFFGKAGLHDSYVKLEKGELWAINIYIDPYEASSYFKIESRRPRKLLMHRKEIDRLRSKTQEKGYTIVPLLLYFHHGKAKLEIGLARGKRQYDRREQIADREMRREKERGDKL
ncbi:MAG: SsrA-binding protein SmpB [bacterium]|jgi:SsrA-binding protein